MFHYDVPPFTGGFVGVDVFFVISGYLITGIVAGEMARGTFSVLGFYERRLRRIAPALLVMLGLCAALSLFVFLPGDLRGVGTGILNAALYTSNILFGIVASDYFTAGTLNLQPVLHTWSLAVEAQFYLLYPGLLLALRWRRLPLQPCLLGLALLSFVLSDWGTTQAPVATFYLLPTRAWELLLGGLVALPPPALPIRRLPGEAWAGLGLIVIASVFFTRATPFPGGAALLPTLGAALALRAGAGNRLFETPPLVFVGRISYSLYLWHWPILVFARYRTIGALEIGPRLALLALSFALAILSWWGIERPFLRRRIAASPAGMAVAAVAAVVAVAGAGVLLDEIGRGTIPLAVLPPEVSALAAAEFDMLRDECSPAQDAVATRIPCRFGAPKLPPSIVLWGNSYARMWAPTLDLDARAHDAAGVSFLRSKCLPLLGSGLDGPDCESFNAATLAAIRARPELTTVVLGGNWFVAGPRIAALGSTIEALVGLGRRVVVILAPPQADFDVPRVLALAALRHMPPPPPIDEGGAKAVQRSTDAVIEDLRRRYGFTVIDPANWICDGARCDLVRDGTSLYFDAGHISVAGARMAAGLFGPIFDPGTP